MKPEYSGHTTRCWEAASISYSEFWNITTTWAQALHHHVAANKNKSGNIRDQSTRIGVLIKEGAALPLLEVSILRSGYSIVPLALPNSLHTHKDTRLMLHQIKTAQCVLVVADNTLIDNQTSWISTLPIVYLEELSGFKGRSLLREVTVNANTESHVFFTSGTTSETPKGCVGTHGSLLA